MKYTKLKLRVKTHFAENKADATKIYSGIYTVL